ncbi:predicted protein [Histoplasma capsulatum var. duboisii H88]|uniref:Predicted protein n=1 Tax=Ajellomyces capsulatus (strain H88) TaxID=544711 RepID=F0UUJ4_AJEC8|nr:predicted protein [Histoplasma capsulatum var. duboisii H88]
MGSGERKLGTESSPVIVLKGGCSILFALIHDAGLLPRILPRSITGGDGVGDDGLDYKKLSISLGYCAGIQLPSLGFQFSDVEFLGKTKHFTYQRKEIIYIAYWIMKFLPILVMALVAVVAATPAPAPEDQRKKKQKHCGEFGDPCSKQPCCGGLSCQDGGKKLVCLPK